MGTRGLPMIRSSAVCALTFAALTVAAASAIAQTRVQAGILQCWGRLPRASLLARCMNWNACFNRIAARGTVITVWCVASDSISASPSNRRRLGQCSHLPIGSAQANFPAITAGSLPAPLSESVVMRVPWSVARTMSWLCSRSASRGRPVSMSPLVSPGSNYTMRVGAFKRNDQHRSRRKGKHYFNNSLTGKKITLSTTAPVDDDLSIDRVSSGDADREKIAAVKADMIRAFTDDDLDTYWKLDRELRWLRQEKAG